MCLSDIEHLVHIFFDCTFAASCWQYVGVAYHMQEVECVSDCLIHKISNDPSEEVEVAAKVLWGIWFFGNRKVWENKVVNNVVAMDWSSKSISDWHMAKRTKCQNQLMDAAWTVARATHKWKPPREGCMKLNVDAAIKLDAQSFSVGLILRDNLGSFIAGKTSRFRIVSTVFEAEALALKEGICRLVEMAYQQVCIESDSLLCVQALRYHKENLLEVGHILDDCSKLLFSGPGFVVDFVKRQAAAHMMARLPCSLLPKHIYVSSRLVVGDFIA